jgi:acyl-CoA synthetase (AMP-forming)/AMP-acid ligase II
MDFSGWRVAILGAERVNPRTMGMLTRLLEPYGFKAAALMPAYGLAEATLAVTGKRAGDCVTALSIDWPSADRGQQVPIRSVHQASDFDMEPAWSWTASCGRPLDGVQVSIVDEDRQPVPEGVLGEVAVSGSTVAPGYLDRPSDSVLTTLTGSCLFTGDDGFIWDDELYVVGRRGDGLKVAGRSLYSEQVELEFGAATAISPNRCTALLGVLDGAEFASVIVEAAPGSWVEPGAMALRRITGGIRHAIYTAPRGSIGRTSSGKPMRREAWQRLMSGELEATCVHREKN